MCAVRPEPSSQVLRGDKHPGPLEKRREDLERLMLQVNALAALAQLACDQIRFERTEDDAFVPRHAPILPVRRPADKWIVAGDATDDRLMICR